MVRVVEYNDKDLPELAEVLKMPKSSVGRGTSSISYESRKADTEASETESDDEQRNNNIMPKKNHETAREIRRKKLEALSASVKKPRRVLIQKSDNPLLRPIGWMANTPTKLPEATPKSRPKRDRRATEERKVIVSDSDEDNRESGTEEGLDESDGMSDFIVNDDESLEEGESEIEMTPPPQPPRSARKLIQGRRKAKGEETEREDLEIKMRTLEITNQDIAKDLEGSSEDQDRPLKEGDGPMEDTTKPSRSPTNIAKPKEVMSKIDSNREDQSTIFPPQDTQYKKTKNSEDAEDTRFTTPPPSPRIKSPGLPSPKKIFHIPSTPHRPSMDNFWRQDVINDWNDEYSPRKAPKTQPKPLIPQDQLVSDGILSPIKGNTNKAKLERDTKRAFLAIRDKLAQEFFLELDEKLANGKISKIMEDSGGVKIIWSKKLVSTAGQAKWKREKVQDKVRRLDGSRELVYRQFATIELAEKVIDDEYRLLNTLAHEFCHLCTMIIDGVTNNPHGKVFKSWATACTKLFTDRGVKVTTRHSYTIQYKYAWECTGCGLEYKRHSKSIKPERQQCGKCDGKLQQTKPVPRPATPGKPSSYQAFVKKNMAKVREENPGSPHNEIMRLIGKKYQESKKQGDAPVMDLNLDLEMDITAVDEEDSLEDILEIEDDSEESIEIGTEHDSEESIEIGIKDDSEESISEVGSPVSIKKKLVFIDLSDD